MNLIEGFLKSRDGDIIFYGMNRFAKKEGNDFRQFVNHLTSEAFLSDNWQIERKPMVWEGEVTWYQIDSDVAPGSAEGANQKIKELFKGKRTKIRIEEIP